jgi:hypothetical protein
VHDEVGRRVGEGAGRDAAESSVVEPGAGERKSEERHRDTGGSRLEDEIVILEPTVDDARPVRESGLGEPAPPLAGIGVVEE